MQERRTFLKKLGSLLLLVGGSLHIPQSFVREITFTGFSSQKEFFDFFSLWNNQKLVSSINNDMLLKGAIKKIDLNWIAEKEIFKITYTYRSEGDFKDWESKIKHLDAINGELLIKKGYSFSSNYYHSLSLIS